MNGGTVRNGLARTPIAGNGTVDPLWNPNFDSSVFGLSADASWLAVGGAQEVTGSALSTTGFARFGVLRSGPPAIAVTPGAPTICNGNSTVLTAISGPGSALSFNGVQDYVSVGSPGTIDTAADFTWEAWVKTSGNGTLIARAPSTGNWAQGGKSLFIENGKLTFDVAWVDHFESPGTINDGQWHHVALTAQFGYSGLNDQTILYIDGAAVATRNNWDVNAFPETGMALKIGFTNGDFPVTPSLTGVLDEVRIWSRVRSAAEIQADRYRLLPPQANLVACFRLDDGSGAVAADASGNGRDGTLVSGPAWVVSTAPIGPEAGDYTWSPATGLSSTTGAVVTASPTSTTTYTVTATVPETGCSNSTTVTVTVIPPIPAAPAAPTATPDCSNVALSWTPVANATDYEVWRSTGGACVGAVQLASTTGGSAAYTDSSATVGSSYSYSVRAKDSCGTSGAGACSATVSLTYPATMNANDLSVTKAGSDNRLVWGAVSGATGYDVYSTTDPAANAWPDPNPGNTVPNGWTKMNSSTIVATTWDHSSAAVDATRYNYHVSPSNACGSNHNQPR